MLILAVILAWGVCFYINRNGKIVPNIGGGCFSSKQPTYNPPAPPTLPTADQLFASGTNYAKSNNPMAFGAREGALTDLQNPTAYYQSFQPTSFEQALGNQSFQNVWPDTQNYMANILGKSGMAYSPVASATLGKEYGNLSQSIGQYLSDQANGRATNSLNARLGIDPMSMVTPFVQTGMTQGNNQANLDYGYQQALAQQQYQQQMNQYQQQAAMAKMFGQISPLGGNIYGASTGHLGDSLGGTMQSFNSFAPALMSGMTGGLGGMFGGGAAGAGTNGVSNFAGNNMSLGANLGGPAPSALPVF